MFALTALHDLFFAPKHRGDVGRIWTRYTRQVEAQDEPTPPVSSAVIGGTAESVLLSQLRSSNTQVAQHAIEIIYREFFASLWRYAYRTARTPETAEEIVQDVFLSIWSQRHTFAVRNGIRMYLYGAVRHGIYNHVRHAKVADRHRVHMANASEALVFHVSDPQAAMTEAERALLKVLDDVQGRDREILLLRWRDGWSYEDIARLLGLSSGAARVVVSRQYRRLRTSLEQLRRTLEDSLD